MTEAKQGHIYKLQTLKVMAMESGKTPLVMVLDERQVWPLRAFGHVNADSLEPLPMLYFGGEVPQ